jgi:predicted nucleic acid-binding protein
MNPIIILDTCMLILLVSARASRQTRRCARWLLDRRQRGFRVVIPEIADYEIRRQLVRRQDKPALNRLDSLEEELFYAPITTEAMHKACEFWAQARQEGYQTADDKALDADVILAAQTSLVEQECGQAVIATMNVQHLDRFVPAQDWRQMA